MLLDHISWSEGGKSATLRHVHGIFSPCWNPSPVWWDAGPWLGLLNKCLSHASQECLPEPCRKPAEALNLELWFWPLFLYSTVNARNGISMSKLGIGMESVTRGPLPMQKRGYGWEYCPFSPDLSPLGFLLRADKPPSLEQCLISCWTLLGWDPTGGALGNLGKAEGWPISDCWSCRTIVLCTSI